MAIKRRIYLINPKFQFRFSILVCIILFISSMVYPWAIYDITSKFMEFAATRSPSLATDLDSKRTALITILALWQLGFIGLTFVVCIFFSHKIAGPLYKLTKYLRSIRNGEPREKLFFRKGDYFQDVADEFNETFDTLQETFKQDLVYLDEVNSYISNLSVVVPDDKKAVLKEISSKISLIQGHYRNI